MNKLGAFVRLDFLTIKPYLTVKNLILFAIMAMFLSGINGSYQMSLGVGFLLGTLFISYPFAIGDKNNLDTLYVTLSITRRRVVLGRYAFMLALNLCAVLFSFVLGTLGVWVTRLLGVAGEGGGSALAAICILAGLLLLVQALQLPIFFKLGYAKARLISIIPLTAFMAAYMAFMNITKTTNALAGLSARLEDMLPGGPLTALLALLALTLIIYVSYRLSVAFYSKREF